MKTYKKGDKIVMNFHCAGVVSQETLKVIKFENDVIYTNETFDNETGEENRKFCSKTGKCLNDSNYFGAWRTIDIN